MTKNTKGQIGIILFIIFILLLIGVFIWFINSRTIIEQPPTENISIENNTLNISDQQFNDTIIITPINYSTIRIANWNLQIFGVSKASNPEIISFYKDKLQAYDIIFVQEIRDASNTSFNKLCEQFPGYACRISDRDGRSNSKEQVGIIYKENLGLITYYTQADPNDVWERSPIIAVFSNGVHIYNAHLKPDDVAAELHAFENLISYQGPIIVLGDFNADCDYYTPLLDTAFDSWNWLITTDTTVSKNDCAYDRIIVNDYAKKMIIRSGVDSVGINTTYSDHYIIWSEILW